MYSKMKCTRIQYYVFLYFGICLGVFLFDGLETLFASTETVIATHNFPDILGLPTGVYYENTRITNFVLAGCSGVRCVTAPIIIFMVASILFYKYGRDAHVSGKWFAPFFVVFIILCLFVFLNGKGVLRSYAFDPFIGHKLLYLIVPLTFTLHLLMI